MSCPVVPPLRPATYCTYVRQRLIAHLPCYANRALLRSAGPIGTYIQEYSSVPMYST